ncbi:MAG: hypothetical protein BWY76_02964 [bacterium ADurb.Bin429]|nr:MAG: hypothetical protein BWY76_02964 [bacterium ADurb.Bin429]
MDRLGQQGQRGLHVGLGRMRGNRRQVASRWRRIIDARLRIIAGCDAQAPVRAQDRTTGHRPQRREGPVRSRQHIVQHVPRGIGMDGHPFGSVPQKIGRLRRVMHQHRHVHPVHTGQAVGEAHPHQSPPLLKEHRRYITGRQCLHRVLPDSPEWAVGSVNLPQAVFRRCLNSGHRGQHGRGKLSCMRFHGFVRAVPPIQRGDGIKDLSPLARGIRIENLRELVRMRKHERKDLLQRRILQLRARRIPGRRAGEGRANRHLAVGVAVAGMALIPFLSHQLRAAKESVNRRGIPVQPKGEEATECQVGGRVVSPIPGQVPRIEEGAKFVPIARSAGMGEKRLIVSERAPVPRRWCRRWHRDDLGSGERFQR